MLLIASYHSFHSSPKRKITRGVCYLVPLLNFEFTFCNICRFFPDKATSLAVDILNELSEVSHTIPISTGCIIEHCVYACHIFWAKMNNEDYFEIQNLMGNKTYLHELKIAPTLPVPNYIQDTILHSLIL